MRARFQQTGQQVALFFHSIRFRMTIWSVVVLALILVSFSVFVFIRQEGDLRVERMAELQMKSRQMLGVYRSIDLYESENLNLPATELANRTASVLSNLDVLVLIAPDGKILIRTGSYDQNAITRIVEFASSSNANGENSPYLTARNYPLGNGKTAGFIFLVTPLLSEHRPVGLMVLGSPIDPNGYLPRLGLTLLLASLATLAALLGGGYWLAGRALAPVRAITRTAREIGETDLHKRLHLHQKDELGELASTFDAMLDRLEAAFNRQRQFTADASHELRTPLAIIGLEADQALSRRRSPEEYERALALIHSENELMARLVNDLLTLARMDAGQIALKREPLDLSDVALDIIERLSSLAQRAGVELHAGDFPAVNVEGDYQYLSQMLLNLVQNAIKYAGGRSHHVYIETGCDRSGSSPIAWVRVEDDGPGIPAEHLPHLFDRFYRVDKSRARQPGSGSEPSADGSGLGLAIVRWIVHAHQGQVTVQSEEGKGTVFEIRLPALND